MPRRIGVALCVGVLGAVSGAQAHAHGMAYLDVAIEVDHLALALRGAGDNFVGFEHTAATPEQVAAVRAAQARLGELDGLLGMHAGCRRESVDVDLPENLRTAANAGGATAVADDGHVHTEVHENGDGGHGHDHEEHDHVPQQRHPSDWSIQARLACADASGRTLDARGLFEAFPRLNEVQVQAIGPGGQTGAVLRVGTATLVLP